MPTAGEKARLLGSIIRDKRRALHLSQEELAERSQINPSYLSSVECGNCVISLAKYLDICQGLACEPSDILRELQTDPAYIALCEDSPVYSVEDIPSVSTKEHDLLFSTMNFSAKKKPEKKANTKSAPKAAQKEGPPPIRQERENAP